MPNTNGILLKLEGFQYTTSLDLNVGYYYIRLSKKQSNLCTIIIPWGKYCDKHLPMEVTNSPEMFQQKMNYLILGFEFIRTDIDDLLVLTRGYWTDYVQKLESTLNKLKEKTPEYNIEKSFFEQTKMKYLDFWVTRDGVKFITKVGKC